MVKIEELNKQVELLKGKIKQINKSSPKAADATEKQVEKDSNQSVIKVRTWRKSLKRTQRRIRFLTGKKLAVNKPAGGQDKKPAATIPAAPAPQK